MKKSIKVKNFVIERWLAIAVLVWGAFLFAVMFVFDYLLRA
jgi:hypothetical protein